MSTSKVSRIDLYQDVTQRIIVALEAGTPPWICPWIGGNPSATNLTTGKPYRGINILLLNLQMIARGFRHNRWITYLQAQELGGRVRRGEQGSGIVFFKMHKIDTENDKPDPSEDRRVVPLLRSYTVFNIDQVEGLPTHQLPASPAAMPAWECNTRAEQVLTDSGAAIGHGGTQAFYHPASDIIQMPPKDCFYSSSDYYATALHELSHWTGHPTRCNRLDMKPKSITPYAFEELVAEMGAAFLCSYCQIPGQLQHASYIASWLKALRDDKRLIFTAASLAQKATDYILDHPDSSPLTTLLKPLSDEQVQLAA